MGRSSWAVTYRRRFPSSVIIRNGVTLNGTMELGSRYVQLEGSQTMEGAGTITTDGVRGIPGGGIEVVNGSLTLGPDFTFHSRRNGSRITVSEFGSTFTNEGTIIADVDDYGSRFQDVPEPSLTIRVEGSRFDHNYFNQNGTIKIVDGYEIRIEAFQIRNAGEIELRGGSLTGSGVQLINTGQFRGRGLFVSTGAGLLDNQGAVAIGDLEAFGDNPAAQIGSLQLAADFQQTATGSLAFDLAGPTAGTDFDRLSIFGSASLAGSLEVSLLEGFMPVAGQSYPLIMATGGILGSFDQVSVVSPGMIFDWQLAYEATSVSILFDFLPGDLNSDGAINGNDFLAWQRGESADPLSTAELADWQFDYNAAVSENSASQAVPEPSSLVLTMIAFLCWQQGLCTRNHGT